MTLVEKDQPNPSWLLLRLTQLCVRADKLDLARRLARAVPDPQMRGLARLEVLRVYLEQAKGGAKVAALRGRLGGGQDNMPPDVAAVLDEWVKDKDVLGDGVAPARLLLAVGRQEARFGGSSAAFKAVDGWDPEPLRPFGYMGVALGIQDTGK
jgi:hypothetical protein